ncbi:MAG TPA: RHS repeat-associated core domain-containing protein, partial [Vitreimonas sp.]|nr:RHS repeat-associated core domain-containing protein [Vitreimonas sp.]
SPPATISNQIWTRQNYDRAGNQTDRCTWNVEPSENCKPANELFAPTHPEPVSRSSSAYDARNNRVSLRVPGVGDTTYDPNAGYQVDKVYITTKTANGDVVAEHLTDYDYDTRDRLETISQQGCTVSAGTHTCTATVATGSTTYGLDENDNRTLVAENNGATSSTRHYCYDARHQLVTVRSATGCSTGLLETYAYDAAGNRTSAPGDTFTYFADGRLCLIDGGTSCPSDPATWHAKYDADGRITTLTKDGATWSYGYDGESRLVAACKASSCSGSGFARLDFAYDGEGHRTQIKETTTLGAVTTTEFRYDGERVVGETVSTGVTRTFTVDETGAIVKVSITGDSSVRNGNYLVVWNGHGDALGLWRIKGDGSLEKANTYTYSTWGSPSLTTSHPNTDQPGSPAYGDLGFRYLYVGRHDVQWDNWQGAGLHYMHARHYSPALGRFVQPDPADIEANLFGYAENSPVTKVDPSGEECENVGNWNCIGGARAGRWWRTSRYARGAGRFGLGGDLARVRYYWSKPPSGSRGVRPPAAAQDKILTKGDIKKLEDKYGKGTAHELKKGAGMGYDLYKKANGGIVIKPMGGRGPGEPTGYNIRSVRGGR